MLLPLLLAAGLLLSLARHSGAPPRLSSSAISPQVTQAPPVPLTVPAPALDSAAGCPHGCAEPPPGCVIKGNISQRTGEKIYHLPGQRYYESTVISPEQGETWFCTEVEARKNGWRKSKR